MKLVGMLDSPYVRRVAVSLELYGVDFVHEPLSVFSTYAEFAQINPVVKAPTLVLDDGTVLMDSSLILDYLEALAPPTKSRCRWASTRCSYTPWPRPMGRRSRSCWKSCWP
ncbi:glutathione S-transferase N-terminal domain-containing protein, partial [Pseudomonas lactis]|uniref:glutathione S-transferase N-terminal domain-containing protein n=1 Tax=Pseudomonas lactis TaxID=1615674 RepID=UPI001F270037